MTHKQISEELRSRFPSARGVSERTVRRYCAEHNIHKLKGPDLDVAVRQATEEVHCVDTKLVENSDSALNCVKWF